MLLAWLLAVALGNSLWDAAVLALISALAALAVGAAGAVLLLTRWQHRPVAAHLGILTAITVAAVAAGTLVASADMFLSPSGTEDLLVVLVSSGTVGAVVAQLMAGRMAGAVRRLAALATRMGEAPSSHCDRGMVPTEELAALGAQLVEVSDRLHAAQVNERTLETSRRELLAWISHDLRTPLSGIRAMAEALEDGVANDQDTVSRYHRGLQVEVERLETMVDDLFQLSRITGGLLHMELETVILSDLVSDALAAAGPVAAGKGVRLLAHPLDPGLKLELATAEFLRLLHNLLENAIRHTPAGGQVSLSAETTGHQVVLAVRDGCGGIPADDLGRVFDLAFRGDPARTPAAGRPGTQAGLGLAIAQGLAQAHGGHIAVRNEGAGCCFRLHLPLRPVP